MNKTFLRLVFCACLILIIAAGPGLQLAGQQKSPSSAYDKSLQNFDEGHFRIALDGFNKLKKNQPGEVLNYYYAGRCLVELNEDLDEAIELLYSASRRGAPDDALFYLAMAYHRDYNFAEAKKYYSQFGQLATRQQEKDLRVSHKIQTCQSALDITARYNQYEVMAVTFLDLSDSASYSQIRMKGGQLQKKPQKYFKSGEDNNGLGSLMFVPQNPLRGDYVFYAGPGKPGKEGMQLYRVKKGAGRSWGDPQEMKALNTEGDEILPYYDPIENDLYFASNGGSGVGGFDLYRSHFDQERDEWTAPINLGFPINSAMDDYLLLPGTDLGMVIFFTNRQGPDSTLTVYRVHMVEPKLDSDPKNNRKLKHIASLGDAANDLLAGMEDVSSEPVVESGVQEVDKKKETSGSSQVYTPVKILSEAKIHQEASDSLNALASAARARVRESEDPNDRWVWQKQIMLWEKKAHDEELLASASKEAGSPVNSPEMVAAVAVVPVASQAVNGEPGSQPDTAPVQDPGSGSDMNRFDILGASPYSASHPIPFDVAIPDGVFYRIQLGAYGSAVSQDAFGGISPITAETLEERGLVKYYAGKFSKYDDATHALTWIKDLGYKDAFVSAWLNGDPVSTQKAKQME